MHSVVILLVNGYILASTLRNFDYTQARKTLLSIYFTRLWPYYKVVLYSLLRRTKPIQARKAAYKEVYY